MRIGLLAGSGKLPAEFLKSAKGKGYQTVLFAIQGITERDIYNLADKVHEIKPFKLGKFLSLLKKENLSKIAILGKVEHKEALSLKNLDFKAVTFMLKLKDKRAEGVIGGIIREIESVGVEVINPEPFLSHLLPEKGVICGRITSDIEKDITFGFKIAKEIATLDVGQTVVVKSGIVIAVEGIEGTDKCIERAGNLTGGDFVVCKAARKNQDMRIDVPTVGITTLETIAKYKGKALCIEAKKTFIPEMDKFKKVAIEKGITVIAV